MQMQAVYTTTSFRLITFTSRMVSPSDIPVFSKGSDFEEL